VAAHLHSPVRSRFGEKPSVRRRICGEAKSSGRSSIPLHGASQLDHKVYPTRVLRKSWLFCQPAPMLWLLIGIPSSPLAAARSHEAFARL
jgi:hypothetical protein